MNSRILYNANIFYQHKFIYGSLKIVDGKIAEISRDLIQDAGLESIDCQGQMLIPGFIDIHTHGGVGIDINAATYEDYKKLGAFFASQGTTAYLASVLTDTRETTLQCLAEIKKACSLTNGAELMGCHLEGPFLAVQYKGAMPEHLLQKGSLELIKEYVATGVVKHLTISPEIENAMPVIKELQKDLLVAIGHSGADYYTACEAIENGARSVTHCFNAMRLFHHHEPAIMGAALEKDVYCEAICDGLHLHPGTVSMLGKIKGRDNLFIAVTDSIMAAGLPDGEYKLGVNDVTVKNGDARLTVSDVRAGSTLTMIRAFRNILKFTKKPLEEVIPLLSENAAKALKIDNKKGNIDVGKDADLLLLNDALEIQKTISRGRVVYEVR